MVLFASRADVALPAYPDFHVTDGALDAPYVKVTSFLLRESAGPASIRTEKGRKMAVVLVADDEPTARSVASLILKSAGHEVLIASNGVEAVSIYRASPDRIDIVLTDVRMPLMDGYQVVRLIRETRPAAKIICMSGNAENQCPQEVEFLRKPFLPNALRALLKKLLQV